MNESVDLRIKSVSPPSRSSQTSFTVNLDPGGPHVKATLESVMSCLPSADGCAVVTRGESMNTDFDSAPSRVSFSSVT